MAKRLGSLTIECCWFDYQPSASAEWHCVLGQGTSPYLPRGDCPCTHCKSLWIRASAKWLNVWSSEDLALPHERIAYLNVTSGTGHLTPLWKGCLSEMVWLAWSTEETSPWYTPRVGPQLMDTWLPNQSAAMILSSWIFKKGKTKETLAHFYIAF